MSLIDKIHLKLAKIRGVRRLTTWFVQKKIDTYRRIEKKRSDKDPSNLRNFEKRVFSQNGEDGIIEEIFSRIGTTNKYFVELGIEDGSECNTRHLLETKGWQGFWVDGSEKNINKARNDFARYGIVADHKFITAENIIDIFNANDVPREFDLLSIDLDGNDYWILKALLAYRPRLLVIEYNATLGPNREWVMPYNSKHLWDGTSYFGASLASINKLASAKGYTLVGCDSQGVNAFFVRQDLAAGKFSVLGGDSEYHYCAPKYRKMFFGHPPKMD